MNKPMQTSLSQKLKPLLNPRYQTAFGVGLLLWILGAWLAQALFSETLWFWGIWLLTSLGISILFLLTHQARQYLLLSLGFAMFLLGGFVSESYTLIHPNSDLLKALYQTSRSSSEEALSLTTRSHRFVAVAHMPWRASTSGSTRWIVALESIDDAPLNGLVLLSLPKSAPKSIAPQKTLTAGQRFRFAGTLEVPDGPLFPGDFSYRDYLRLHHIDATAHALFWDALESKASWLETTSFGVLNTAIDARRRIIETFRTHLPQGQAELLGSIVLGEHAIGMDDATKAHFRGLGLAHLLAASGLNVGIVAGFILFLGHLLKLPTRLNLILAMAVVLGYALMTGMPPSICRAATMFELGLGLKLIERHLSTPLILCLAAWFLTLWDPSILLQLGFQLSFLSTLGIVLLTPKLTELLGYWLSPTLAGVLVVPLVAQVWVLPLQLSVFQEMSLMALPANILVLPIVALLTCVGFVSGGLVLFLSSITTLSPNLNSLIAWCLLPAQALTQSLLWLCQLLPEWTLPLGLANGAWGALLLIGVAWVSHRLLRQTSFNVTAQQLLKHGLVGALLLITPISLSHWAEHQEDRLALLRSEKGAANTLIQTKEGHTALILTAFDWKSLSSLKTYLRQHHISRVESLVIKASEEAPELDSGRLGKPDNTLSTFLSTLEAQNTLILKPPTTSGASPFLNPALSAAGKTVQLLPAQNRHWFQLKAQNANHLGVGVLVSEDISETGGLLFRIGQRTYFISTPAIAPERRHHVRLL